MKRALALVSTVLLLTFAGLGALEVQRGERALAQAEAATEARDWPTAIAAARVAAEARVPYTDHGTRAREMLERIATRASDARDPDAAEVALRLAEQLAVATGDEARRERLRSKRDSDAPVRGSGGHQRGPRSELGMLASVLGVLLWIAGVIMVKRAGTLRWVLGLSASGSVCLVLARLLA